MEELKLTEALLFGFQLFIFDSSDESEEETEALISSIVSKNLPKTRKCVKNYVEKVVSMYSMEDFQKHFRVSRTTFEKILPFISKKTNCGRPAVPYHKQLLICLWMLGNQECLRSVADRFDNDRSTIRSCVLRVCDALIASISMFISWPSNSELEKISKSFEEKTNFPGVIGCVDGTHIPILKPHHDGDSYVNRKGFPSIHLQAVCNDRRQFIHVFCGMPGSVHDARVLRRSNLLTKLENLPYNYHVLGDSAYPLSNQLITPYRNNCYLTAKAAKFNKIHSSTRIAIEHSFGMLKHKFRSLKHINLYRTDLIPTIIITCCILHNIAIDDNFDFEEMDFNEYGTNDINTEELSDIPEAGKLKRDYLCDIVCKF